VLNFSTGGRRFALEVMRGTPDVIGARASGALISPPMVALVPGNFFSSDRGAPAPLVAIIKGRTRARQRRAVVRP